jgi:hypothetical protein
MIPIRKKSSAQVSEQDSKKESANTFWVSYPRGPSGLFPRWDMHWAATSWFYLLLVRSSVSLVTWIHGGEHAWDVNWWSRTCLRCEFTVQANLMCFRTSPSSTPYHGLAYWTHGIPSSYAEWTLLCGWAFISYVKNFENQTGAKWQSGHTVHYYCLAHEPPNCCMFLVFFFPRPRTCY